jgi:transcriptional regulator with XRE-family HTH domain
MIRQKIIQEMHRQGLTISELARRVDCRRATLSDYLHGKHELGSGLLEKVFEVVGLRVKK